MERLVHLIAVEIQNVGWKPLTVAKKAPKLSHMFFADDLVLFAKASLDHVMYIFLFYEVDLEWLANRGFFFVF